MKTFAITFAIVFGLFLVYFLRVMLFTKPTHHKGNRIKDNWKEGGKIVFWYGFYACLIVSLGIAGIILAFNYLENS